MWVRHNEARYALGPRRAERTGFHQNQARNSARCGARLLRVIRRSVRETSTPSYRLSKMCTMATTTVSSKGQIVIPRNLREKHRLTSGVRLRINETDEGLVLSPIRRARSSTGHPGWRSLRGCAKGTDALKQHLEEHRRETKR